MSALDSLHQTRCVAPDGTVITAPRGKLVARIEADVERRPAAELHRLLVADAVKRHATDLRWATLAYSSIGRRDHVGAEVAFGRVLDEVEVLTGLRLMPL